MSVRFVFIYTTLIKYSKKKHIALEQYCKTSVKLFILGTLA